MQDSESSSRCPCTAFPMKRMSADTVLIWMYFVTLFCVCGWVSCEAAEDASSLAVWKQRFHRDRELVKQPSPTANVAIVDGFAVLGQTEEAIRAGTELTGQKSPQAQDRVIAAVASRLSRIDRIDEALALVARVSDPGMRARVTSVVVHGQINRGDFDDAVRLLPRLPPPEQENVVDAIIRHELDSGQFDSAAKHLDLIKTDERRERLQQLIEETRTLPPPHDDSYVPKKVDTALKQLRERQSAARPFETSDPPNDPKPDSEVDVKLITSLATAKYLHARRDAAGCRRELREAWGNASKIEDEDRRIAEQMVVACAAFRCDRELAKEMFRQLVANAKSDGVYTGVSLLGLTPMSAMIELLSTEELGQAVKRWQAAELPFEYLSFAATCSKEGRLDRLDWLYGQTESIELRLVVAASAMERLVQNRK